MMVVSGAWALGYKPPHAPQHAKSKNKSKIPTATQGIDARNVTILYNLGISQLLLTLLTFTTAHVQIITRISSACPVWVWFLAMPSGQGASPALAKNAVTGMVLYAIIQGALFSSFLPPA